MSARSILTYIEVEEPAHSYRPSEDDISSLDDYQSYSGPGEASDHWSRYAKSECGIFMTDVLAICVSVFLAFVFYAIESSFWRYSGFVSVGLRIQMWLFHWTYVDWILDERGLHRVKRAKKYLEKLMYLRGLVGVTDSVLAWYTCRLYYADFLYAASFAGFGMSIPNALFLFVVSYQIDSCIQPLIDELAANGKSEVRFSDITELPPP